MRSVRCVVIFAGLFGSVACRSGKYYITEGDQLFSAKKYDDALLIYRKAIQREPKSAEAYYKLALVQRATSENAAALTSLSQAVALNPGLEAAQIELGDLYLGSYLNGKVKSETTYQRIASIADHLLAKDPRSFAGLRLRGYLAISDKKPEQAVSYFKLANEIRPKQPDVILGLTQGLWMEGLHEQARSTAEGLIQQSKTFGPAYDALYSLDISAGYIEDAEAVLKFKVANNLENLGFKLQLAEHYWHVRKTDEARKLLNGILIPGAPVESYTQTADFCRRVGEWDRAISVLDAGMSSHPEAKLIFQKRTAEVLAQEGKRDASIGILNNVLQEDPSASDARRARAVLLLLSNNKTDRGLALRELQSLTGAASDGPDTAFQLGRAYVLNGQSDQARQQFELVIRKEPTNVPALLALTELHSNAKQFQQSLSLSERILATSPGLRNARLLHATARVGLGQLDRARSEYLSLIQDEPQYTEAKLQLALLSVAQKRITEAEKLFRETYRPKEGDFRALKGLVEVYAAQGQIEKSIAMLRTELDRFPASSDVRQLLAATAARAHQTDLAIQQYEQILHQSGDDLETCAELGRLYQLVHDLPRSVAMLQRASDLAPNDARNAARLATVQQEAGMFREAKSNYKRALRLGAEVAGEADILNNLAYLEADMGQDLEEALAMAQKALSKSPTNPEYADTVGFVYLKKGQTAGAMQVFGTLCQRYPKQAIYRYHLALALWQKGDAAGARRELRATLEVDPALSSEPQAKELLRGLSSQPKSPQQNSRNQ